MCWQVVIGDVRFEGKAQNLYPHSSQTEESRIAKIDTVHLCPNMTAPAKFGSDRFTGTEALLPRFHVDFTFFLFFLSFFSGFFDTSTVQKTELILMVDSSNDVFPLKEVPLGSRVSVGRKMRAWLPKNPFFRPRNAFSPSERNR